MGATGRARRRIHRQGRARELKAMRRAFRAGVLAQQAAIEEVAASWDWVKDAQGTDNADA